MERDRNRDQTRPRGGELASDSSLGGRVFGFFMNWRAEIFALAIVGAAFAVTPAQTLLLVYKAAKLLVGVVIGYWSFEFVFGRAPNFRTRLDRILVTALLCAGIVGMGGAG